MQITYSHKDIDALYKGHLVFMERSRVLRELLQHKVDEYCSVEEPFLFFFKSDVRKQKLDMFWFNIRAALCYVKKNTNLENADKWDSLFRLAMYDPTGIKDAYRNIYVNSSCHEVIPQSYIVNKFDHHAIADSVSVMNEFTKDRIRELYEFLSRYDAIKDVVL